jgi:hypothetical protein
MLVGDYQSTLGTSTRLLISGSQVRVLVRPPEAALDLPKCSLGKVMGRCRDACRPTGATSVLKRSDDGDEDELSQVELSQVERIGSVCG